MRLFCFHHAGGGSEMFNAWGRALGPRVEVIAVEIANRERFGTLRELVGEIDEQLRAQLDGSHAFFGHSFGALVAYRLASVGEAAGRRLPHALFVSSYAPPHLPAPIPVVDRLDDQQLASLLADLGGMPPELAEWRALRDNAVRSTRIDLRLCMTDEDGETAALSCPIRAFGGSDDPLVSESDLRQWGRRTSGEFSVQTFPGGHFYLCNGPQLFGTLRPLLSGNIHPAA
jgi:surfactin synthase thioesterase subunit